MITPIAIVTHTIVSLVFGCGFDTLNSVSGFFSGMIGFIFVDVTEFLLRLFIYLGTFASILDYIG